MANEDKAAKKAAKKAEKANKKQAKAEAKKRKKQGGDGEEEESSGGKAAVFFVTVIIIILWLAIFALLIKWDVGGFGSTVLYPILKDVPYVNRILPEVESEAESGDAGYSTLDEALEQIKVLEQELAAAQSDDNSDYVAELEAEVARLRQYEEEQSEFEKTRSEFYEEVVFSDSAPDIEEYKKYYESIDPTNAELLYKEVVEQVEYSDKVEEYASTYASMKPKQAAALMENMTGNMKLVAQILENMSTEDRAKILDAMDSSFAAQITELMAP